MKALEVQEIRSELGELENMLAAMPKAHAIGRLSLESRQAELKERLQELRDTPEKYARAALYFGGKPVMGSRGVDDEFGPNALKKFKSIISVITSELRTGAELSSKGRIPQKKASQMFITDMMRGSVGFELQELTDSTGSIITTELSESVESAVNLINVSAAEDDDFDEVISTASDRVLTQLKSFFNVLNNAEATIRVVTNQQDFSLSRERIELATRRTTETHIDTQTKLFHGTLEGLLPDAHRFELRVDGELIKGSVDKDLSADELRNWNRKFIAQNCTAKIVIKEIRRHEHLSTKYNLIELMA